MRPFPPLTPRRGAGLTPAHSIIYNALRKAAPDRIELPAIEDAMYGPKYKRSKKGILALISLTKRSLSVFGITITYNNGKNCCSKCNHQETKGYRLEWIKDES